LERSDPESKLAAALRGLANTLLGEGVELDLLAVKRAARRVPRVAGQRMEWAGSVGLDAALARHLPPGTLDDGLAGLRAMSPAEEQQAVAAFLEDAKVRILEALRQVRVATGSKSAAEANSKFDGFEGSFASLKDFHAGAEATLQLGYPNPDTMKGIRLEHTEHPSVARLFVTPNYRITTSLAVEHAWAADPAAPPKPVAALLGTLRAARGAEEGDVQAESRCATLGGADLSLVRGESKDVDIVEDAHTATFRWHSLRPTSARSAAHGPLAFNLIRESMHCLK
jgi:hypothetical protein